MKLILFLSMWAVLYFVGWYYFGYILKSTKSNDIESSRNKSIFFVTLLVALIFHFYVIPYHGLKKPGSIFERIEYKAEFYINLFPDKNSPKNYRVPAKIQASVEYEDYPDAKYH